MSLALAPTASSERAAALPSDAASVTIVFGVGGEPAAAPSCCSLRSARAAAAFGSPSLANSSPKSSRNRATAVSSITTCLLNANILRSKQSVESKMYSTPKWACGDKGGGAEEPGAVGADGAESAPRVSFRLPEATGAAASPGDTQRSCETAGSRPNGGPAGGPEGGVEGGGAEALGAARIGREPTLHGSSRLPAATGAAASPGDAQRSREMAGPRPDCGSSEIFAAPSRAPPPPSSGDAPRLAAMRVGQVGELALPSKMAGATSAAASATGGGEASEESAAESRSESDGSGERPVRAERDGAESCDVSLA